MKKIVILTATIFTFIILSCATDSGDKVECPGCDNTTELLVGNKCVPIENVEQCGPDGHAHAAECHCFSGQQPTQIDGKKYCVQQDCSAEEKECSGHGHLEDGTCHCDEGFEQDHDDKIKCVAEHEHDIDHEACEAAESITENVTAVSAFDKFSDAHVDLATGAEITLPEGKESFVHFPVDETGEIALYIDREGVFDSAYDKNQNTLTVESAGANEDCSSELKEVYHISATNDTGSKVPAILKFKAAGGKVRIYIHELSQEHSHD